MIVLHPLLEVRLAQVLSILFDTTHALALEQCLIVCARGDFVRNDLVLDHLFVDISQLINLLTNATGNKQFPIYELYVPHGLKSVSEVVQHPSAKVDEVRRVPAIYG